MRSVRAAQCLLMVLLLCAGSGFAQIDELREATGLPLSPNASVVYGRIVFEGAETGKKPPAVYVLLLSRNMMSSRTTVDRSGFYYFREFPRDGGTLIVEVDGIELARQSLLPSNIKQQRYDFTVMLGAKKSAPKPGTVSAKYAYERSEENAKLLEKAAAAIEKKQADKSIAYLKRLLENDSRDFVGWSLLGSVYFGELKYPEAEAAYTTAIGLRPDLTHTMINLGKLYLAQKQPEPAIEIAAKVTQIEPNSAAAFGVLGEAYLYAKKGSLAIPALNEAIRLAPVEMARCHLLLAWLYDASGEKHLAAVEYKVFLEKVPDHPEKTKFEKYVRENSR